MRQHRSLLFWSRVRVVNWLLATIVLVAALSCSLSRQIAHHRRLISGHRMTHLAFSTDGKTLVGYGARDKPVRQGEVCAWDAATGKRLWTEVRPTDADNPYVSLAMGHYLVTVRQRYRGPDGESRYSPHPDVPLEDQVRVSLVFRDTRTGKTSFSSRVMWAEPQGSPMSMDATPDGRAIAIALRDRVILWDAPETTGGLWRGRRLAIPAGRNVEGARFTRDGRHILVARARDISVPQRFDYDSEYVEGGTIVTTEVRDARTSARIRSFTAQRKPGDSPLRNLLAVVSADRRRIATLTQNEASARLSLWDVETGKLLRELSLSSEILPPTLVSDSFTFATRPGRSPFEDNPRSAQTGDVVAFRVLDTSRRDTNPEALWFWDTKNNRIDRDPPESAWVPEYREAVSPDGRLVATAGRPGDERLVRLRDARTGRDVRVLEGDDGF